jgi:hypothetical protein
MALKPCKECGKEVSTSAAACPHCGAPVKAAGLSGCGSLVVGFGALVILAMMVKACDGGDAPAPRADNASTSATPAAAYTPPPPPEPGSQWSYTSFADDMGRGDTHGATVRSTGTFELDFPYQGQQHAMLVVRRHPRHGLDVMLRIEQGQILCGIDDCDLMVRFDEGDARHYSASEPADNSSEVVFINDAAGFLKRMKGAKRVRIEMGFFQNGSRTLDFDVSDFSQDKFDGKPAAPAPAKAGAQPAADDNASTN